MGFWILIYIFHLFIPILMIGFGYQFMKKPPKYINRANGYRTSQHMNRAYGYRTSMSMKNEETWEFAHRLFGKLWFRFGVVLLVLMMIALILLFNSSNNKMGIAIGVIYCFQTVGMLIPIGPTELALRKRFHKNGKRKEGDKFT